MPDDMDLAQGINEEHLVDALAEHRRRQPKGESRTHCEDCEDEIPEARRKASPGCTRCIDCQTTLEHWRPL